MRDPLELDVLPEPAAEGPQEALRRAFVAGAWPRRPPGKRPRTVLTARDARGDAEAAASHRNGARTAKADAAWLRLARPLTRGECRDGPRPCPFVACPHHLYLEADRSRPGRRRLQSIKLNWPQLEPGDLIETCSLDVAEHGAVSLQEVGDLLNVTRERARQIEEKALVKLLRAWRLLDGRARGE